MRAHFVVGGITLLTCFVASERPAEMNKVGPDTRAQAAELQLKSVFESKIKLEWEAIRNKDKRAYGELLAEEYQGVEVDGRGERNKVQAINEMAETNVANFTIWGLKVIPLAPDAAFAVYEVTMLFPPRAQVRYLRVYVGSLWVKRGEWKELHYQETPVK